MCPRAGLSICKRKVQDTARGDTHSKGRSVARVRVQLKCVGTRLRREGKWRGNWRMEWVASTLHTTSEHGVSSITTADAHTSAASSRLN